MKSKMPISCERCQDLFDYLETMRLPMESPKSEIVPSQDEEKKEDEKFSSPIGRLNDPSIYSAHVPFLIYDENKETIISRTTKGINEGKLNPFEVDWGEVTLYETHFVRDLLEGIDSKYLMDVAQAIDDEDTRHAREDGQFTNIASNSYGTGQGDPMFYSYMRDNWQNNGDYVSAISIGEGILDKRKKAEDYNKKIEPSKNEIIAQTIYAPIPTVPVFDSDTEVLLAQISDLKNDVYQLTNEKEKFKAEKQQLAAKVSELEVKLKNKVSEIAFTASGNECFTKAKMGLLVYTIASLTDGPTPTKKKLVPIISAIGGWEVTSVNSEMKKAGFNQQDIDAVAKLFESAMPKFASEIRKQISRRSKTKSSPLPGVLPIIK